MSHYYHQETIDTIRAFSQSASLTNHQLCQAMGIMRDVAKSRIDNMYSKGLIESLRDGGGYRVTLKGLRVLEQHSEKEMGDFPTPKYIPTGTYDGAELKKAPARGEAAMRAYSLPSRGFSALWPVIV